MATQPLIATIIGMSQFPNVPVNVRSGPGLNNSLVFRADIGTTNLQVLQIASDTDQRMGVGNKVFQWLNVQFPNGITGWVRDDLINIQGDGSVFGYGFITQATLAFFLRRQTLPSSTSPTTVPSVPTVPQPVGGFSSPSAPVQPNNPFAQPMVFSPPPAPVQPSQPFAQPTSGFPPPPAPVQPAGMFTQPAQSTQPLNAASFFQPTPVTPPTVAPPITTRPQPAPQAPPPAPPAQPSPAATVFVSPDEPATAICMGATGVNIRSGPGTNNSVLLRFPSLAEASILDAQQGQNNDIFKWIKISYQGREGWIREDYARLKGNFEPLGIGVHDQYPCPMKNCFWQRDFNVDPVSFHILEEHWGWDQNAEVGEPILAGPNGGFVVRAEFCQNCGSNGASVINRGFQLSDRRVLNDPNWNFGYGHCVIVRYDNDILPESTRELLTQRNFSGAHLFVMYAHLHQMRVQSQMPLQPEQIIGTCGNSGNSSGTHLHLEVRAGKNPQSEWSNIRSGLMTPAVLFRR